MIVGGAAFSVEIIRPVSLEGRCRWVRTQHDLSQEAAKFGRSRRWRASRRRWVRFLRPVSSGNSNSRADDSVPPFEMSVETALKLLGVAEDASFDDIMRAKNSIIASCKDDLRLISQVEAAYDMLLMKSLSQRRAGKVMNSSVRYADVRSTDGTVTGLVPGLFKSLTVSVEVPPTTSIGVQAGIYGILMASTFATGPPSAGGGPSTGADVCGLILATGFGFSLYFLTKKNVSLGKAAALTAGGLVMGAVVGSAFEKWLQVDIVPFLGIHSPAILVSEFILFFQFMVSLCLS